MKNLVNKIVLVIAAISISLLSFTQQYPIKIQFLNNEGSPVSDTSNSINEYNGADGYGDWVGWSLPEDGGGSSPIEIKISTNIFDRILIFDANSDDILPPNRIGIKSTLDGNVDVYEYENYEDEDNTITSNTEIVYDSIYYAYIEIQQTEHTDIKYFFKIKFIEDNTASVVENEISVSNALVYPNPVMNNLTVEFETSNTTTPIEVYSSVGQLIYRNSEKRTLGKNHISIDMSQQPKGVYLMHIGEVVRKFVRE